MSHEDLPLSAELASAYLDGELDAHERAAAGADPEVLAAVDSFIRVRAALNDTDPVIVSTRNAAISAAMAEFDALRATNDATKSAAGAIVTPLQSQRMRTYRVVAGFAAALVVGVVALSAINSSGGSNNDLSSSATAAPTADAVPTLKATADTGVPAATDGAFDAAGSAEATAAAIPAIDSREALQEYAASVELQATTAAPAAPESSAAATVGDDRAPAAGGSETPVSCISSDQSVLGFIFYRGTPAVAVRNTTTGALQAIADTDCRVLDEVPAP